MSILTTEAELARLLRWLDPDVERAPAKYEQTRSSLIGYFLSHGCHTPEDQTDRTFDRVARRLGEGVIALQPAHYIFGVARLILLEYYRRHSASAGPPHPWNDDPSLHDRYECMGRCLERLPPDSRTMLVEYSTAGGPNRDAARRELAARMGISLNTLRIRVHRLREHLARSLRTCSEHDGH
jgi:DNA-directed RNA polymerase specialized sigma24 family protein